MKNIFCIGLLSFLSVSCIAQKGKTAVPQIEKYWLVILKTGPKDSIVTDTSARNNIFSGHMANMGKLHQQGILKAAGPFGKNDFTWRGLFILDCKTKEDAEKYLQTDPAIAAGIFVTDIVPWYSEPSGSFVHGKPKQSKKL